MSDRRVLVRWVVAGKHVLRASWLILKISLFLDEEASDPSGAEEVGGSSLRARGGGGVMTVRSVRC